MKTHRRFSPRVESLDERSLMSLTLTNGLVELVGSTGPDVVTVTSPAAGQVRIVSGATGNDETFSLSEITGILIRVRAGDDQVTVNPSITLGVEIRGWAGNDTINGGGGGDTILGGGGNDYLNGRGGNDSLRGQHDDDFLLGGAGDDTLDGQLGGDLLDGGAGTNNLLSGTDINGTFDTAIPGIGSASLTHDPDDSFDRTLTISIQNQILGANQNVQLFLDGSELASTTLDSTGSGQLVIEGDFDTNDNQKPDFLEGLDTPLAEITPDSIATVKVAGFTVFEEPVSSFADFD